MQIINIPVQTAPCSCHGTCHMCSARSRLAGLGSLSSSDKQKIDDQVTLAMTLFATTWALRRNLVMLAIAQRDTGVRPRAQDIATFVQSRAALIDAMGILNAFLQTNKNRDITAYNNYLLAMNDFAASVATSGVSSADLVQVTEVAIPPLPRFVTSPPYATQLNDMRTELEFYGAPSSVQLNGWAPWIVAGTAIAACVGAAASTVATWGLSAPVALGVCATAKVIAGAAIAYGVVELFTDAQARKIRAQNEANTQTLKNTESCYTNPAIPKSACDAILKKSTEEGMYNPKDTGSDALDKLTTLAITLGVVGIGFMLFKSGVFSAGARAIDARTTGYRQLPEGRVVETSLVPLAGLRKRRRVSRRRRHS